MLLRILKCNTNAEHNFYELIASIDIFQVCVDLFMTAQTYVDIASISVIPSTTGGQVLMNDVLCIYWILFWVLPLVYSQRSLLKVMEESMYIFIFFHWLLVLLHFCLLSYNGLCLSMCTTLQYGWWIHELLYWSQKKMYAFFSEIWAN